jgi:hypothetical protein
VQVFVSVVTAVLRRVVVHARKFVEGI